MSNKYKHQDLTNQFAPEACILEMQSTGLTEEPVTKGEISHGRIVQQDTMTSSPSINASAPFEKVSLKQNHHNEIRQYLSSALWEKLK
ncbi:hypothetical protein ES288_D01G022500v1 [Gossypium darwinii]|uniref:Uncharacterized protein n=1 Tax=Gossypium darwinii TaxID=34276 RepID=A0A5D2DKK4_GOSDA|nr:hypothetical protein ES288_D01G022500v1 [Gossypium darwinii]